AASGNAHRSMRQQARGCAATRPRKPLRVHRGKLLPLREPARPGGSPRPPARLARTLRERANRILASPFVYSALASGLRPSARTAALSPCGGEGSKRIPLPRRGRGLGEGGVVSRMVQAGEARQYSERRRSTRALAEAQS